jgi:hypothetical protein
MIHVAPRKRKHSRKSGSWDSAPKKPKAKSEPFDRDNEKFKEILRLAASREDRDEGRGRWQGPPLKGVFPEPKFGYVPDLPEPISAEDSGASSTSSSSSEEETPEQRLARKAERKAKRRAKKEARRAEKKAKKALKKMRKVVEDKKDAPRA